jgi:DNA-directed RNA polymerase specialized sigma24 family protein
MLQAALECLSAEDRKIIHLAFERDLSRRDIVTIMGKPSVTAVTSHLRRAMQKLKFIIERQGYFGLEAGVAHGQYDADALGVLQGVS